MMNLLSIKDIGSGSGSRFLVDVFGSDDIMIGFRTKKAVQAWIASKYPHAFQVSADVMRAAKDHYYAQYKFFAV